MGKSAPTTTTTSAPPPEIMAAYKQVMDRAAGVADTPYTAYGGNLVAGMSGIGQFGTNMVQDGSAAAQSSYDAASGYAGQGAQAYSPTQVTPTQFSGAALQQYMSPYTQNVIDSTMANINQNNAIQASSLTSNGIQSGNAFGGDRLGVAQAELARGQSMSSDQTIAGLWNQNFAQALGQFNQQQGVDLSAQQFNSTSNATAAQNNAARALQASQLSSGIASGVAGSSLAAGSNLQSYGQQQQATDQAGLSAAYQQWQAAQSFPYAQTQWLSGIQSGLGSLSGGTSQSVGTAPSAMNQVIGGVTAAAGLFSDERVKEDIKEVGKTHDGQKVYTYRYKGLPQTHMGLMAQEVEGEHPEAVGVSGGVKTVDYKAATRDAEVRRASGGGVMPYSGVGFIPQVETKHGAGVGIPTAKAPDAEKAPDFKAAGSAINGLVDGYLDKFGQPSTGETSAVAGASSGMMGGVSFPMFASGGAVARRGVAPRLRGFASGGSAFQDRMDAVADAVANGDFDPQGLNYNEFKGEPAARSVVGRGTADVIPIARAAPADDPVRIDGVYDAGAAPMTEARAAANYNGTGTGAGVGSGSGLPPQITGPANDDLPSNVMAFDRTSRGVAPASSRPGMVDVGTQYERPATEAPQQQSGFGGLFEQAKGLMPHLSENAKTALITAGLSMMASRSPNVGQAIGEGGLAGMNAYAGAQKAEREAAESDAKMANDQTKLQMAQREAQRTELLSPWIPDGKGGLMPRRGGSADPEYVARLAASKAKEEGNKVVPVGAAVVGPDGKVRYENKSQSTLDEDTVNLLADRVLQGDTRALVGLGKGAQGGEDLRRIQGVVARKAKEQGIDARGILTNIAEQAGQTSAERSLGTRRVAFGTAEKAMEESLPIALEASKNVPRTSYPTLNKMIQAGQTETGDPKLKRFLIATDTAAKDYARTINPTGVLRESDIAYARKILSTADGPEAYAEALDQLKIEAGVMSRAMKRQTDELRNRGKTGKEQSDGHAVAPAAKSDTASAPTSADAKAVAWAKANPNDPRSAAILKANGQ